MGKDRLAAFSDGVIAIIITIMVLELKIRRGAELCGLCDELRLCGDLLEQSPSSSPYRHPGRRPGALGQFQSFILAVACTGRDRLARREFFGAGPDCSLRHYAVDTRRRLVRAAKGDHQNARPAIGARRSTRPRPQRQGIAGPLYRRDRPGFRRTFAVDRPLQSRRRHVADPRSPDREGPARRLRRRALPRHLALYPRTPLQAALAISVATPFNGSKYKQAPV